MGRDGKYGRGNSVFGFWLRGEKNGDPGYFPHRTTKYNLTDLERNMREFAGLLQPVTITFLSLSL